MIEMMIRIDDSMIVLINLFFFQKDGSEVVYLRQYESRRTGVGVIRKPRSERSRSAAKIVVNI